MARALDRLGDDATIEEVADSIAVWAGDRDFLMARPWRLRVEDPEADLGIERAAAYMAAYRRVRARFAFPMAYGKTYRSGFWKPRREAP